jgi:hypothetical protein
MFINDYIPQNHICCCYANVGVGLLKVVDEFNRTLHTVLYSFRQR